MSRQQFDKTKRERVQGDGPDRQNLPSFYCVGKIDSQIRREILYIVSKYKGVNDNYSDEFNISKFCDLGKSIPKGHISLLLQKPRPGTDGMNEKDYTMWDKLEEKSILKNFLQENFPNSYRTRIVFLPGQSKIDWHIDINTKVSCRFHILIKNPDFVFEIDRKHKIDRVPFKEDTVFFTNTAYPHRVYNSTNEERISVLFDIDYKNVKNILPTL